MEPEVLDVRGLWRSPSPPFSSELPGLDQVSCGILQLYL